MGIEHRKVTKNIKLLDSNGNPIKNQAVKVTQKNHAFLFGCGAFDTIPYVLGQTDAFKDALKDPSKRDWINEYDPKKVVESWLEIFNYGTLPFYWGQYEKEEGKPERDSRMKAAEFLNSKNVKVKGHPLCWHTVCADWLLKYDNETIIKKQLERIDREVSEFKGVIDMWDVINEVVIMPIFDKYDNAITRICKEKGRVGLIKTVFDEAHSINKDATLILNDFNTSISYEILIDGCLEAGVPISAIGIQSHQHQGYWGKDKVYEVLDRFSCFGLPIHFTENTLISGDIMPAHIQDLNDWQVDDWPTTTEGEERQAKEMEEMYRILFEHPLVEAITTWDFKDGAWLGAPSGFIRKDNTRKPSFEMLKRLTHEEWWTDKEFITNENGVAEVDAFKGDYVIAVNGKEFSEKLINNNELILTV